MCEVRINAIRREQAANALLLLVLRSGMTVQGCEELTTRGVALKIQANQDEVQRLHAQAGAIASRIGMQIRTGVLENGQVFLRPE